MASLKEDQMSASPLRIMQNSFSGAISQWWQDIRRNWSPSSDLSCCAKDEVERIARDLGMSAPELRALARRNSHSTDLLARRLAALGLDKKEIIEAGPGTLQDLQRLCTMCDSHKQCTKDMDRDPTNAEWEEYCPNVSTLKMLDSMKWATWRV